MKDLIDLRRRVLLSHGVAAVALVAAPCTRARGNGDSSTAVALLTLAHGLLQGLHGTRLAEFLEDWPSDFGPRQVPSALVPAVRWLPRLQDAAPRFSASFVAALAVAAPALEWRRSYSAEAVGAEFFRNYGWTELAGLSGPVPSEHLACGVLVLGPGLTYPPHRHEAEEIYVPLSGAAEWRQGRGAWRVRPPGSVIHHSSNEPHAMRTGRDALLALYLWRSENLAQKSRLD